MSIKNGSAPGGVYGGTSEAQSNNNSGTDYTTPTSDRAAALLRVLRARYPVVAKYHPLAIGIRQVLRDAMFGVSNNTVSRALAMHCNCGYYLEATVAGGPCYALDGTPCGEVTEAERCLAKETLAARVLKHRAATPTPRPRPSSPGPVQMAPKPKAARLLHPGKSTPHHCRLCRFYVSVREVLRDEC